MFKLNQQGQSLIEVVVAAAIMMVASVVLLQVASMSMANTRLSQERIVGTRLAQEGWEWLKRQQGDDWQRFFAKVTIDSISDMVYCLEDAFTQDILKGSINTAEEDPGCVGTAVEGSEFSNYYRTIKLTPGTDTVGTDTIGVVVTVNWSSRNKLQQVKIEGDLKPQ